MTRIPPHNAHASVMDLVGNTPLVRLPSLEPQGREVQVYGKLEGQNPGGSVKDRAALYMIRGLLERGELQAGHTLLEATSGNTGIALAMMARASHVPIELLMPENSTRERVQTMRAYGATVTLTPANAGMEGAIDLAREKAATGRYYLLNQFGNPDNPRAHIETTGPEIWRDTAGQVTHFVSSMGTTGTIMGVSTFLKAQNVGVEIVGVQPADGARIPGIRRWPTEYLPANFDPSRVDRTEDVTEEEATAMTRYLARAEGVFAGMSSGGAGAVAQRVAAGLERGVVVFIVCDRGDRYLSSDLFEATVARSGFEASGA